MSLIDTDPEFREAHHQLHRLWTKAVGTPDYVKKEWQELENMLSILARRGGPSCRTR